MKFAISAVSNSSRARVGKLESLSRLPDLMLETPFLFLYSKGGCIPHLTLDVLEIVAREPLPVQLPLPTIVSCHEPLKENRHGIAQFIGMENHLVYCSVQDPAMSAPVGYNKLDKISVWSRSGKEHFDVNRYMDVMEAFQPDLYQCLGDGETNINSTNKRIAKSIRRSLDMFYKCLQRHQESEVLKKSGFIASLQGGYDLSARKDYAKEIAKSPIDGYVIDGLHDSGSDVQFLDLETVKPIIAETVQQFPEDKFRIVHGCWSPEAIIKLVEEGIDAFDSSFAFTATEGNCGFTFSYKCRQDLERGCCSDTNESSESCSPSLRPRSDTRKNFYGINLEDTEFKEDFGPILKGCTCSCCTQHTRAYIHHLITNKELLGRVLLMMHNLHHYLEFFKAIRKAVKGESLSELRTLVSCCDS